MPKKNKKGHNKKQIKATKGTQIPEASSSNNAEEEIPSTSDRATSSLSTFNTFLRVLSTLENEEEVGIAETDLNVPRIPTQPNTPPKQVKRQKQVSLKIVLDAAHDQGERNKCYDIYDVTESYPILKKLAALKACGKPEKEIDVDEIDSSSSSDDAEVEDVTVTYIEPDPIPSDQVLLVYNIPHCATFLTMVSWFLEYKIIYITPLRCFQIGNKHIRFCKVYVESAEYALKACKDYDGCIFGNHRVNVKLYSESKKIFNL